MILQIMQNLQNEQISFDYMSAFEILHPSLIMKCRKLFENGHFSESAEKGFKVVRDRLRDLTGFENGSDAFGRGRLQVLGATAKNVESDFHDAVQFLTMSIDKFRNEKAHTANAKITDPKRAYAYLQLSNLAMLLLDNATITNVSS